MALTRLALFILLASIILIIIIIDLTRRRRLEEKISLLWISVALGMMFVSIASSVFGVVSVFFQEQQGFVIIILSLTFMLFIILALSIRQSKHKKKIIALSQEIALLKNKVEELKK